MPGLVRIGRTQRWPEERVRELYSAGTPEPFTVDAARFFVDSYTAEERIIDDLCVVATPYHNSRFFMMDIAYATDLLRRNYQNQHTYDDLQAYTLEARIAFEKMLVEKRSGWPELVVGALQCLPASERERELVGLLAKTLELGRENFSKWLISECGVDPETPLPEGKPGTGIGMYHLTAYETAILCGHLGLVDYLEGIGCELLNSNAFCWVIDCLINDENKTDAWKIRILEFGEKLLRKNANVDQVLNVGLFAGAPRTSNLVPFRDDIFPRNSGKTCREVIQMLASTNPYFAALNMVLRQG